MKYCKTENKFEVILNIRQINSEYTIYMTGASMDFVVTPC